MKEKFSNIYIVNYLELSPDILLTSTALIYDATMILAEALKQIGFDHLQDSIEKIYCYDAQSTWSKGYTIVNYMKNVICLIIKQHFDTHTKTNISLQCNYTGLTGPIEFDTFGIRSNIEVDVMVLKPSGLQKTGTYKPSNKPKLNIIPIEEVVIDESDLTIDKMTFTVITALV